MNAALHWKLYPAARFADFAAEWDALAQAAAMPPALAAAFVAPLLECFGDPRALLACARYRPCIVNASQWLGMSDCGERTQKIKPAQR